MQPDARECSCGARIVGDPLGETPFKVKRFGPVMIAVGSALAVATASVVISIWAATLTIPVLLLSRRAMKSSRQEPDLYGGYTVAAGTSIASLIAAASMLGYAVYRVPLYLEHHAIREQAQTEAIMFHITGLLEDYKARTGSYPTNTEAMKKLLGGTVPADYWDQQIRYRSYTGAVATNSTDGDAAGETLNPSQDFELRSAGPDGVLGTADDIVMRDGVFYSSVKVLKEPISKDSPDLK